MSHALIFTQRKLNALTASTKTQYTVVAFQEAMALSQKELINVLTRSWNEIIIDAQEDTLDAANHILRCWKSTSSAPVVYLRQVGYRDNHNVSIAANKGTVFTSLDEDADVNGALFKELLSKTYNTIGVLLAQIVSTMGILFRVPKDMETPREIRSYYGHIGNPALSVRCKNEGKGPIIVEGVLHLHSIPPGATKDIEDFYDPVYYLEDGGRMKFWMSGKEYVTRASKTAAEATEVTEQPTKTAEGPAKVTEGSAKTAEESTKATKTVKKPAVESDAEVGSWKIVNRTSQHVNVYTKYAVLTLNPHADCDLRGLPPILSSFTDSGPVLPIEDGQNQMVCVMRI